MCLAPSHCCCLSTVITNAAASPPPPSFSLLLSFVLCYQFQIFRQPLAFFPTPCHSQGKTPLVFFSPVIRFFIRNTFIVFTCSILHFQAAILLLHLVDLVLRPQSIGSVDDRATNLVSHSISAYMGQDRGNCQYRNHHQILLVG